MQMFEVSGTELQKLDDVQLRTLVARLAIAELRARGLPVSGVTAGGDQNAPDGGLDVRVELQDSSFAGDFVPRVPLGIQVKKPDMARAAILSEMMPSGVLRAVIGELAEANGGYVIVSSQGSVADKPLQNRRKAMKAALGNHPSADKLHLDFFDRDRLATWVNQYPGVAAWVRGRVGRPLVGWQSLGDWSGTRVGGDGKFIFDDAACLVDGRSTEQAVLPILEGINCIRGALSEPGQCIRLIGMSGLGKTRVVQALFESDVGNDALDPSLAVYADYSETPNPTAKHLALQLVETGQRAILVVDNCNPQTHSDLAKICSSSTSKISLITVEYDVRDDVPERTEVFRLQSASSATVAEWLKANFTHVSQNDRERIAEFSGGNFRVADVLAETVKRADSLGNLRDRELFRRIFQQRHDHSDDLLTAAETLALLYSFDGEDTAATGELAFLAQLTGIHTAKLYAFVADLKSRSVAQSRGKWRALLPHAIANRLATQALERIPPDQFDAFCASIPPRMRKSLSKRLGYLHDSDEARKAVARWLQPNGPFGDLLRGDDDQLEILRNIAPVAPKAVLQRIENAVSGPNGAALLDPKMSHRWQLTMLLKALAYTPDLFNMAAKLLAKFVAAEATNENHNSASEAFTELFHLHLSGTHAPPEQRRSLIRSLFECGDEFGLRCGTLALRGMLQSGQFSSASNFDFGTRPRDFGWLPPTHGDIWNWYIEAVALSVELATDASKRGEIRQTVSGALRGILRYEACLGAIEAATEQFRADGEWNDGWLAVRGAIRFDGKSWPQSMKARVLSLEARLRPSDQLNIARAYVIEGRGSGFDLLDGDEEAERDYSSALDRLAAKAKSIGQEIAQQPELLNEFLTDLLHSQHAPQAFSFGAGLADSGIPHREMWEVLRSSLVKLPSGSRNATTLGGFLRQVHETNAPLANEILDDVLADAAMAEHFVYLQARVGIVNSAMVRLRKAIASGRVESQRFLQLASGVVRPAPQAELAAMLLELSALDGGTATALEIFHMAIYCLKSDAAEIEGVLLDAGHQLLVRTDYKNSSDVREHRVQQTIKDCYAGPAGEQGARELCQHLRQKLAGREVYAFQLDHVFDALFEVQPLIALDELMVRRVSNGDDPIYGDIGIVRQSPLEKVDPSVLWSWADRDPTARYTLISRSLNIFATKNFDDDDGLSALFVEALERSPDRAAFLSSNAQRLRPRGWSGNLSVILNRRRGYLRSLADHPDSAVKAWVAEQVKTLEQWANSERERESEREESFE